MSIQICVLQDPLRYFLWCPDVDGPCVKESPKDSQKSAVIYCLDDIHCSFDLIMPPRQERICKIRDLRLDPGLIQDENVTTCSSYFYECVSNDGLAMWQNKKCPKNRVFSRNTMSCTDVCEPDLGNTNCETSSDGNCKCIDDVGINWIGSDGQVVQRNCSSFQQDLIGMIFFNISMAQHSDSLNKMFENGKIVVFEGK